jgi:hypothetical protein
MSAFPRIYQSFQEFEREELRKLDSLRTTVDDLLQEEFSEELNFDGEQRPKRRGRPRRGHG